MLEYLGYIAYEQKKKKEGFSAESPLEWIFTFLFSLLFSILAAYLSWGCNTSRETDNFLKVIYAIIAFLLGFFYLIFYFFVNYLGGACRKPA